MCLGRGRGMCLGRGKDMLPKHMPLPLPKHIPLPFPQPLSTNAFSQTIGKRQKNQKNHGLQHL